MFEEKNLTFMKTQFMMSGHFWDASAFKIRIKFWIEFYVILLFISLEFLVEHEIFVERSHLQLRLLHVRRTVGLVLICSSDGQFRTSP